MVADKDICWITVTMMNSTLTKNTNLIAIGNCSLSFLLYLGIGTLYYNISPGYDVGLQGMLGLYEEKKEVKKFLCVLHFSQVLVTFLALDYSYWIFGLLVAKRSAYLSVICAV